MLSFLNAFLSAYIDCSLWSSFDDNQQSLDRNYSAKDIDPVTMAQMEADCLKFYTENNLEELSNQELKHAGYDFWLTRNHHGAGFWDGDWPEPFSTLATTAARGFGPFDLSVTDDAKLQAFR